MADSQTTSTVNNPDAITPYPNLVKRPNDPPSRKTWTFKNGKKPRTDLTNRVMIIPIGEQDDDHSDRLHEMLHVAFSPQVEGLKPNLLCIEDARIQILAGQHGIEVESNSKIPPETGLFHALMGSQESALQFAIAVTGSPLEDETLNLLEEGGFDKIVETAKFIKSELEADPSFDNAYRLSDLVESTINMLNCVGDIAEDGEGEAQYGSGEGESTEDGEFGDASDFMGDADPSEGEGTPKDGDSKDSKSKEEEPKRPKTNAAHMTPDELKKKIDDALKNPDTEDYEGKRKVIKIMQKKMEEAKKPPAPKPYVPPKPKEAKKVAPTPGAKGTTKEGEIPKDVLPVEYEYLYHNPYRIAEGSGSYWGDMHFHYPPLDVPCLGRGKGPKATDFGVTPVRLHRVLVDQKVFTQPRGKRRGTVLCDMSGSMSLTEEQILEMLNKAPAAVIAGYWGGSYTGTLRILAANGFRAREIRPTGYNNLVDGPAVEWLARQKVPRIYITDEGFTGLHSAMNSESDAVKTLYTTVERARIKIVKTIDEAIKSL